MTHICDAYHIRVHILVVGSRVPPRLSLTPEVLSWRDVEPGTWSLEPALPSRCTWAVAEFDEASLLLRHPALGTRRSGCLDAVNFQIGGRAVFLKTRISKLCRAVELIAGTPARQLFLMFKTH